MGNTIRTLIEMAVWSIEGLAIAVIVIATLYGTLRFLFHLGWKVPEAYDNYKVQLGKALLLGLQLLVAADVVRTVALEPTMESVVVLGLLVIVRTFLSLSTVVEIEGRWPWQKPTEE